MKLLIAFALLSISLVMLMASTIMMISYLVVVVGPLAAGVTFAQWLGGISAGLIGYGILRACISLLKQLDAYARRINRMPA